MVEDRDSMEIFVNKLDNSLKHSVARSSLRLSSVSEKDLETIVVKFENGLTLEVKKEDPKIMVENILKEPELSEFFQPYKVLEVDKAAISLMKNFQDNKYPESFEIVKLPYRQIKVQLDSKTYFFRFQPKSYMNLLRYLDNLETKSFKFENLFKILKRKELVTILLSIKNFEI